MQRLFLALDLPEALKTRLKALCVGLAGARWITHAQMHLTLRFIGDVDAAQQAALQTGLATIRATPFKMALQGIGQFPPKGNPRVIWAGIQADDKLYTLQNRIEQIITGIGFEPADHTFSPHITLARFKIPPSTANVQHYMALHQSFKTDAFEVTQFILFSSHLTTSGPIYRTEGLFPLI
ncbi:MAG: RNA 2',3'-cyclic phosphodiesterase [Anaerolineae bacterium]|nr:RNA 2',3'-cyclic phosphodiesterase [Anaerolineae bacterium]